MAETGNIATMAERLSTEPFSEFLWERVGPMNWNWQCIRGAPQKKNPPFRHRLLLRNPVHEPLADIH